MKFVCRVYSGKSNHKEDSKLNIFTAKLANESPQSIVACTRYPITQKLLDEYLRSDQDLLRHRTSILEQADFYQFDQVFGGMVQQQQFYNHVCSSAINECLFGTSSTFWILGSEDSGKEYTLRGGDNDDYGIMLLAIDNILHLFDYNKKYQTKQLKLACSIFTVNKNEMVDLIGNVRSSDIKQTTIKAVADFKKLWKQSQFQLKNYMRELQTELQLQQQLQQQIIVTFYISSDQCEISQVNFINYTEFSTAMSDIIPLKQFIMSINQQNDLITDIPLANKTFEAIYLLLNQSRFQNITLIAQVSSTQTHFLEAFRTLQFLDEMRPYIIKNKSSNKKVLKQHNKQSSSFVEQQKSLQTILSNKQSPQQRSIPQYQQKKVQYMKDDHDFGIDIGNLKSSIMNRIDQALVDTLGSGQLQNENVVNKDILNREQQISMRHFSEIKELLREKDKLEEHQRNKAEQRKQELKEEVRQLRLKQAGFEDIIKQRDQLINQLEQNLDEKRQQIDQGKEMFISIKQKEGLYEKNQEELRDMVTQLNQQSRDQENELLLIKQRLLIADQDVEQLRNKEIEYIRHYESREDEFLQLLREERKRHEELVGEIDYFQNELRIKQDHILKLEEQLGTLNRVVEDQQRRIEEERLSNQELREEYKKTQKISEDQQKENQQIEHRQTKIRTRLESELGQLKEEKLKYLKKYKLKIQKLKPIINSQTEQINKFQLDNQRITQENEQLNAQLKQIQSQLGNLKQDVPQMEKQNYGYQNELDRMKQVNERINEAYHNCQGDLQQQSLQLHQAIDHLDKLTQQFDNLQSEYEKLQFQYNKSQNDYKNTQQMLERVCDVGHVQMDELDAKITKMSQQILQLQQEKAALIRENSQYKQELQDFAQNEQKLEKKLSKQIRENNNQKVQLREMNQNLKEMIIDKHSEIKSRSQFNSNNQSYRSIRNKDNIGLSSNSKRDFLMLELEDDSVQDI